MTSASHAISSTVIAVAKRFYNSIGFALSVIDLRFRRSLLADTTVDFGDQRIFV
jgi:hypothetical protein